MSEHGPVGRMMVEITDLRVKIALLEHNLQNATGENISLKCENKTLKEEIEKLRSLLLQGTETLEDLRR